MQTDRSFLNRLHRREHEAFRHLFETYFKRLYDFAASVVFDAALAEDIVQAVFLDLYENPSKLSHEGNIGGWLFVATRNACYRYLNAQKVEDRRKLLYLQAVERADAHGLIEENEAAPLIGRMLDTLPERCRQICEMRFLENMPFSEIARKLSISENTARVQVFRAIEKLRRGLWSESITTLIFPFLISFL